MGKAVLLVVVHLENGQERFAGHFYGAELAHALLAFLLLFKQLLFTGNIAAVTLGQNVLAHGLNGFTGDNLAADSRLDRDLSTSANA